MLQAKKEARGCGRDFRAGPARFNSKEAGNGLQHHRQHPIMKQTYKDYTALCNDFKKYVENLYWRQRNTNQEENKALNGF